MQNIKSNVKTLFTDCVFLFLTGAVIGWIYEVLLYVVTEHSFINRGMLHGPWLPIYGLGCLIVVGLKLLIGNRPVIYFAVSTAACGIIEYTASWAMETFYDMRWWDYSSYPLNLNGRIFVGGLLGFGAAGLLFAYVLLPLLQKQYKKIPDWAKSVISVTLLAVFLADAAISLISPNVGIGISNF